MSPEATLDPSKDRPSIYKALALIFLPAAALMSVTPFALAQDQTRTRHAPAAATASEGKRFTIESDLALSKMSLGMTAERTGDVRPGLRRHDDAPPPGGHRYRARRAQIRPQ